MSKSALNRAKRSKKKLIKKQKRIKGVRKKKMLCQLKPKQVTALICEIKSARKYHVRINKKILKFVLR